MSNTYNLYRVILYKHNYFRYTEPILNLVYCIIDFQYNDAEWIFTLQGGGMRRCGGIVD